MSNPFKRGADPYADAGEVQERALVSTGIANLVVSGANTATLVAPVAGKIKRITLMVNVATTSAVSIITIAINGSDLYELPSSNSYKLKKEKEKT